MQPPRKWSFMRFSMGRLVMLGAWLLSLAGAFRVGAYVYEYRTRIRSVPQSVQPSPGIETNLYNLRVHMVAVPAEGRDGGIAPLGNGLLFANRKGRLWYVDRAKSSRALNLRIPINIPEFEADPYNATTTLRDRFAVKDLLVQTLPSGVRILASHNHWHSEKDCYTLRVSSIETSFDGLLAGTAPSAWKTVFETYPCRLLPEASTGKNRLPTNAAGGRLVAVSDREILITVGRFGPAVETTEESVATHLKVCSGISFRARSSRREDLNNSYGKTILFNLATGASCVFTTGHRNPQGLAATADTQIWVTEHAERGGDELNLLVEGKNYGFPHVSYGTKDKSMIWPANPQQGRHEGYQKPTYAWVPSIGVSQLIVIEGSAFPFWKGDLLVTSLVGKALYRLRIEGGSAIYAEPIPIGHRIRDIAETADGSIVLKTDDNFLVYLEPAPADRPDLTPMKRGQVLARQCQACHTFVVGGASGIGPSLWGVVGRRVASVEGFNYSDGLKAVRGRWTAPRLRSFLRSPETFAPGTAMQQASTYAEDELSDLVAYLQTLR
ncbi:MAG: PQQ-dependent sugar dehydrogenase [Gemmatimonadota bacterium]|nr:PQQ-dependent sugar dehydrogenase [Gemmatimonadota bacterium]